jgi:hypothetical protein
MFSLRAVNLIKKASIASRIVAGVPKIASPSIQRVFLSNKASYKQQVVTNEPAGNEIIENMNSRTNGVSNAVSKASPTLQKFGLDGKVAIVTG